MTRNRTVRYPGGPMQPPEASNSNNRVIRFITALNPYFPNFCFHSLNKSNAATGESESTSI